MLLILVFLQELVHILQEALAELAQSRVQKLLQQQQLEAEQIQNLEKLLSHDKAHKVYLLIEVAQQNRLLLLQYKQNQHKDIKNQSRTKVFHQGNQGRVKSMYALQFLLKRVLIVEAV